MHIQVSQVTMDLIFAYSEGLCYPSSHDAVIYLRCVGREGSIED